MTEPSMTESASAAGAGGTAASETPNRTRWAVIAFWTEVAFLVIVPIGLIVLVLSFADDQYPGSRDSPDCVVAGYPTNIDVCRNSR